MTNHRTKPYDMSMTKSPMTDAYLDRARRRDAGDPSVCRHNMEITECRECRG